MTYDEIIAQMQEAVVGIRKAIYGVEVREHIAVAMENVLEVGRQVINKATTIETSEANAKASADRAKTSETNAKASETNAAGSETSAEQYASAAKTSETNAKNSADKAVEAASRATAIAGGTDKTLSNEGAAADAKAVGDALKNYLGVWTVTLPVESWVSSSDISGYPYKCTVALTNATSSTVPSAVPTPASFATASEAGLASICETQNGTISFWAENAPTGNIQLQVSLLGRV